MTRARDVADTQDNVGGAVAPFVAGKNKILNGDFSIWQRGTSFTINSNTVYTADRMYVSSGSGGTCVATRQTFTPGSAPVAGYEGQYFLQVAYSAGGSGTLPIQQLIENVRTFAGQTITISLWLRVTSGSVNTCYFDVVQDFGTGGSATTVTSGPAFTVTTTWQRYTTTINVPSISGATVGTANDNFRVRLNTPSNTSTWQIWGFQTEAGSVATPFTTATGNPASELAACQRYYERIVANSAYGRFVGGGVTTNTVQGYIPVPLKVKKRASVTSIDYGGTIYSYDGAGNPTVTSLGLDQGGESVVSISVVGTGYTAYRVFQLLANNDANAYIGFNAEL
jgi:hypothetical protein